jgi:hypothetical protein
MTNSVALSPPPSRLYTLANGFCRFFSLHHIFRGFAWGKPEEVQHGILQHLSTTTTIASYTCAGLQILNSIAVAISGHKHVIMPFLATKTFIVAKVFFGWAVNVAVGLYELMGMVMTCSFTFKTDAEIQEMLTKHPTAYARRVGKEWLQKVRDMGIEIANIPAHVLRHQAVKKFLMHFIGFVSCLVGIAGLCMGGYLVILAFTILALLIWGVRFLVNKHYVSEISFDQIKDLSPLMRTAPVEDKTRFDSLNLTDQ